MSTYHLHLHSYIVGNADWISSLSEQETETKREHRVCEDYFHHLPTRGPLMEEPTWGRVSLLAGRDGLSLSRVGEYDINLVIYTIGGSP